MNIQDVYVTEAPSQQNVVDIFKGEWSSKMPAESLGISSPGPSDLFNDSRIHWLSAQVGGFAGKRVLEVGPLEAGHTYMLHKGGAASITSVESNSRSFLKCLCIKELFALQNAHFLFGDAMEFLDGCEDTFELGLASGVLYHMANPLRLIAGLQRRCRSVFVWTHYFDAARIAALGDQAKQFSGPATLEHEGASYGGAFRTYGKAVTWAGFSGSGSAKTFWLTKEELFRAFAENGFSIDAVDFDHPSHQNGPAIAFIASRT